MRTSALSLVHACAAADRSVPPTHKATRSFAGPAALARLLVALTLLAGVFMAVAPAPAEAASRPVDKLNWKALARCESGGNPRAVNPAGYYGLYQFNLATWRSVGGKGYPHRASASEQTKRAKILYKQRGARPWPTCGRLLYG